jgi:hypothetical protein
MATPVTPATANISAIPDPKRSPVSYQAYMTAQADKANADALAKSNAQIQSGYQPILDFYAGQEQKTNARYAQNAANLTTIFGALSGISAKDTANINNQFASSIAKQKADLVTRTTEQRAAQEAGMSQLAQTGAERGNGPALGGSPTATATEAAIGQSQAIQQNWEGLMGAQQANAITDITNRKEGYGQQEVAANAQLSQNLQDALAAIGGQQAGIQGQIAQAKIARDQAIQNNQYDIAAAAQKQIDAMKLQASKNTGLTDVAQIRAAAQIAAKKIGGAAKTPKKPTYGNNVTGTMQRIADTYGAAAAADFQNQLDTAVGTYIDAKQSPQSAKNIPTNAGDAYKLWAKNNKAMLNNLPAAMQVDIKASARQYLNSQKYVKPSTATSNWSQFLSPGVGG